MLLCKITMQVTLEVPVDVLEKVKATGKKMVNKSQWLAIV